MLLLRLTSSDSVRGLESDDGFTIGQFSAETIFLLLFTTLLGLIVGIVCIALRSQLPGLRGAVMLVLAGGTLGAAVIVKPDGIDFTKLGPLPLACALFTIIPLAATASTLLLIGRCQRVVVDEASTDCYRMRTMDRGRASSYRRCADDLALLLVGVGALHVPLVRSAVTGRVGWIGTVALTSVVTLLASVALIGDIAEIV